MTDAAEAADTRVRDAAKGAAGRLRLAAAFYAGDLVRYGRAELSFLRWEIARGVLNPPGGEPPGSRWWRAVNDRLLRDKAEAALLDGGHRGEPSSRGVRLWGAFLRDPSPAAWYRAHNASVVAGYLGAEPLALAELPAERFLMNVALVRVLYAHALVARPRLALGVFAPLGGLLGDPRGGSVGFFLDLRRAFPERYPLDELLAGDLVAAEGLLPRALDYGVIVPRLVPLYEFAAESLGLPGIEGLISDGAPCYAWPARRADWHGPGALRLTTRLTAYAVRMRA
ncbi:hypothetical protein E1293_41465 [Actinomadura darangshiensis]|uniref:Uncharacterized protein n=1 Tax=Actinomadura darangshiensis TaxID=705336 RepID=A0A4R5A4P9_9ACTN|nr:hypothetical protein [Actinomadura darangshiensis]TDD64472.1 hypothetical protein E1293_41465 [Actinomadura darangshiensis]